VFDEPVEKLATKPLQRKPQHVGQDHEQRQVGSHFADGAVLEALGPRLEAALLGAAGRASLVHGTRVAAEARGAAPAHFRHGTAVAVHALVAAQLHRGLAARRADIARPALVRVAAVGRGALVLHAVTAGVARARERQPVTAAAIARRASARLTAGAHAGARSAGDQGCHRCCCEPCSAGVATTPPGPHGWQLQPASCGCLAS
jgi:hypothetical protein